MILRDFHIHTTFSDGTCTPEEMAEAAYKRGVKEFGFSDHSYTHFDTSYCMPIEKYEEYVYTINKIKDEYKGKMDIKCGIEIDMYSPKLDISKFDYIIASGHYVLNNGDYICLDESWKSLENSVERNFDGDYTKLYKKYYEDFADFVIETKPFIVGHFNYVIKENPKLHKIDENSEDYIKTWKIAVDRIIDSGVKLFEINIGGIPRGYRDDPYPDKNMMEYICSKGGKFILSSDSHSDKTICYNFENFEVAYEKYL